MTHGDPPLSRTRVATLSRYKEAPQWLQFAFMKQPKKNKLHQPTATVEKDRQIYNTKINADTLLAAPRILQKGGRSGCGY